MFLTGFKKDYVSVRKEVLHNILTQFVIPMKLVMLIRMLLYETRGEVRITGHFLFRMVINKEVLLSPLPSNFASEYAIRALQETELDTSALGLCG